MQAVGIINHNKDDLYNKKTANINGEIYFIGNDSMPESVETGVFNYHPDELFALYLPEDNA